jgi:putative solute:sodium symporter small subunit
LLPDHAFAAKGFKPGTQSLSRNRQPGAGRNNQTTEEANAMQLTDKHREYWSRNLKVTSVLLAIWFVATFVVGWFARELNAIEIIGPLGFYMGAQGSLIIYVLIIWYYGRYMNNLDKEYGVHEGEDD